MSDTCAACVVPALLSSVVALSVTVWPAAIDPPLLVRCEPALTVVLPDAPSEPPLLSTDCPETSRFVCADIAPWLAMLPPCTATAPLPPMTPPCAPVAVVPAAFTSWPVVVTERPSPFSDVMRPAVLSSDDPATDRPAALCIVPWLFAMAPPLTCIVPCETIEPPWFAIRPDACVEVCTTSGPCAEISPPWFDRLRALSVTTPPVSEPPSLSSVPAAFAMTEPPALVVAPARFRSPAVAFSDTLPFVAVSLPARLMPLPESVALPPATFSPVAFSCPAVETLRSPELPTEPSLFTPAPSVPVDATLPALMVRPFCAASVPLLVRVPGVLTVTNCCA
ncbi:hypothetical protein LMG28614_06574 [Paraburkholderia ultramafica]|uniref:Uncharacterized protein n=1 Tax=Paraburkholderia ultramafica TaxID=1544867 RepID=A0A6S7BP62_9BURK|nr:hypothetical protein LMG28614_06574 [Paraburkholderia ultramafica]